MCKICSIENQKLLNRIENLLLQNDGVLLLSDKRTLKDTFPDHQEFIDNLSDSELEKHYEYHQRKIRIERQETTASLTSDINKDEAEILYGVINKQAQTFGKLTAKINEAIEGSDPEDFYSTVQPGTLELYREVSKSMRDGIRLLNELNASINGSKSGAMEGLMALAKALTPGSEQPSDLTTDEYD